MASLTRHLRRMRLTGSRGLVPEPPYLVTPWVSLRRYRNASSCERSPVRHGRAAATDGKIRRVAKLTDYEL
jgi:hypothetical protein